MPRSDHFATRPVDSPRRGPQLPHRMQSSRQSAANRRLTSSRASIASPHAIIEAISSQSSTHLVEGLNCLAACRAVVDDETLEQSRRQSLHAQRAERLLEKRTCGAREGRRGEHLHAQRARRAPW